MLLVVLISFATALVTFCSYIHGIGLWFLLMIIHGIIYQKLGAGSEHLPFYAGLAVLAITLMKQKWTGVSLKVVFMLFALIIVMGLSALLATDQDTALLTLLMYMRGFFLVLLLAGCLKDEKDMKIMTLYCLAGLTIGALAALYQYKTGNYFVKTIYDQRVATLRGDPNDTAMLLVAGIPLAFYWLLDYEKLLGKLFFVSILLVLIFGIVLTGSRGGFVSLLTIMFIMFIRKPSLKVFFAGMLLSTAFIVLAPHTYWDRMETLITRHEEHGGSSLQKRAKLQLVGLEIFMENCVFGVGPGNFGKAYMQHVGGMQGSIGGGVAHNMYLEYFVENGFLGGALIVYVFAQSILGLLRYDRLHGIKSRQFGLGFSIALALFGMLLSGLFLSQAKNSMLWFITGMGIAAGLMARKVKKREAEPLIPESSVQAAS